MTTKRKAESHLRAMNLPRLMNCGGSQADSERDSGFSDASSEHTSSTDPAESEDSPQAVAQGPQGLQKTASGQPPSQLALVGGSYSGLSQMIIMNNVLLKQPVENPPSLKPWGFNPTVEMVQPVVQQPQVVFLQPVVSRQASPASKEATSKHRRSKKYLPILKSYPKIAPHPGDISSSSGRGTISSSSSSSGSEKCSTLTSTVLEHTQREKVKKSQCGSTSDSRTASPSLPSSYSSMSPLPQGRHTLPTGNTSVNPASERPASASRQTDLTSCLSFSHTTSSKNQTLSAAPAAVEDDSSSRDCSKSNCDSDTKRKRFCNTYNILSNSGLLDITLRTKELLRQNQSTQNELDRLKKHTDLFLQAWQTGDAGVFAQLLASLQEEDKEKGGQSSVKADWTRADTGL